VPRVVPFPGLGYALDGYGRAEIPDRVRLPGERATHPGRIADLTDLVCPPYDVISDEQRAKLLAREPHNAVRLELNPEPDAHAAAARALAAWIADGTLERRDERSVYYYGHARPSAPDELAVQGVVVRVLLEPWGAEVRPHEHTMPGPKAERLALLRATRTQLSPILAVYFDRSDQYRHLMGRPWSDEWRARDDDGLLHQLAAVEPDERLVGYLSRQRLYVADGHHRYETALAYQAEVRSDPRAAEAEPGSLAADWIMMVLVNAEREDLEILATHRLLPDADADLLREPGPLFDATPMPAADLPAALEAGRDDKTPLFGLVLPGGEGYLLLGNPGPIAERMRSERTSTAVRRLDLAVLHASILEDRLGIDPAAVAGGERLIYTRDAAEAIARATSGEVSAAFLVRPTRLRELAEVAGVADVMPQKSTYFYPKLLTGMVFNPLED
jgi:uncharacterized protein (DUF1015 family)